jgi:prepilin-type N-terminal cleavage/methylation domain-containing protein
MQTRKLNIRTPAAARRGFTAIEIAMVATVIAIFALLVLPIFRNRVEQARLTAANADLISLYKALTLEAADTGAYVRLEDLDNTEWNTANDPPNSGVTLEAPIYRYGTGRNLQNPDILSKTTGTWQRKNVNWKGPYVAFQNAITYYDINQDLAKWAPLLRSQNGNDVMRPIQDIPPGQSADPTHFLWDAQQDPTHANRYPADPWGNPYLFYPANNNTPGFETAYGDNWLICTGPDGLPGAGSVNPNDYLRTNTSVLGTGDDIVVRF